MLKKGSKLYSIFRFKCPYCNEGPFFISHPYDFKHAGDTPEKCEVCGNKFEPETGFYYGGMYVSYALGVAIFIGTYLSISIFYPTASPLFTFGSILLVLMILGPLIYALSKIIWINIFVKYQGNTKNKQEDLS